MCKEWVFQPVTGSIHPLYSFQRCEYVKNGYSSQSPVQPTVCTVYKGVNMSVVIFHIGYPGYPGIPTCPGRPPNPFPPFNPGGPGGPGSPGGPDGPGGPNLPGGPGHPGMPGEPATPMLPMGPFDPGGPCGPATPFMKNPMEMSWLRRSNVCMEFRISWVTSSPSLGHCSLGM